MEGHRPCAKKQQNLVPGDRIAPRVSTPLVYRWPLKREERVRLLRAHADLREIELAKQRSQLIAIADYERTIADLILMTKARILAIPSRLAPELMGETSRAMMQSKIEKSCKEALAYLAKAGKEGEALTDESLKAAQKHMNFACRRF